ncbi:unnamed protein product [Rhizophagus irregularis]|nr:unnamed protein product [Rhizophagus irregularis]CAB4404186.1 unnamed protein product [Rhizophagus irregularis]
MSEIIGFEVSEGIDMLEIENGSVKVNIRPNLDSDAFISSDGIGAKVGGVGFKVGKVTGINTPLGSFEINFEKWLG